MRIFVLLSCLLSEQIFATITKPELSDRSYRYIELDNSLKVLLIADPTTNLSAASLDVFVGSNNDPIQFPGLAHLLEHMLFLGRDQFPEAGDYQNCISKNGGFHNAYTSPEHTNYFFGITPDAFEGALNRFSQLFVAPTLNPTDVKRELISVHSEYQSKSKDESRRSFEAAKKGLNPKHPIIRFSTGNLDTLEKDGLINALTKFFQTQYSANRMSLVLIADRTLDELENLVQDRFSQISNQGLHPAYVSEPLFDTTRLPYVVESRPVAESRVITLLWPIPNLDAVTAKAPITYISHLLGHEGESGLLSRFKNLGWAIGLVVGNGISMTDSKSMSVSVNLTKAGFENREEIISDILKAIKRIEFDGLSKWRFDELKTVSEAHFRFSEESDPISTVSRLAKKLHTIPVTEIFTRGNILSSFDAQIIRDVLTWLKPERMLVLLRAPEIKPDETTTYYPTRIRQYKLSKKQLANFALARSTPMMDLKWPEPNPFIAHPSRPLEVTRNTTSDTQPNLVFSIPGLWGYVLTEDRFSQPRSDLFVKLRTALVSESPENRVMSELLAAAINERFNTLNYTASLAGASFGAQATQAGIILKFSGFQQVLSSLIDAIFKSIRIPLVDPMTWNRLYQEKKQILSNARSTRPFSLLYDEMTAGLMPAAYTQTELQKILPSITQEVFHQFQLTFFSGFHAEIFLHGPVSIDEGRNLLKSIAGYLPINPNSQNIEIVTEPWIRERMESHTVAHPDGAVLVAYVSNDKSPRSRILNQLAGIFIDAPFYNSLRTEKQLGYLTFTRSFSLFNTPVLSGVIQSSIANPDELTAAITQFTNEFPDRVASLSDEQYKATKRVKVNQLLNPPLTQSEMSNAIWQAIELRRPYNDRVVQAAILNNLSKDDFVDYLRERLQNPIILKAYSNRQ